MSIKRSQTTKESMSLINNTKNKNKKFSRNEGWRGREIFPFSVLAEVMVDNLFKI